MRTLLVFCVSIVLGTSLGLGTGWARWGRQPDMSPSYDMLRSALATADHPAPSTGPQPKTVVDIDDFDFGTVERNTSVEHVFHFTNKGEAPLTLRSGGTSCGKCTISKIDSRPIGPGETGDVVVVYSASIDAAQFRQSATILTNDPLTPRIVLGVSGKIVASYTVSPKDLVFSKLAAGESKTAEVRVVAYLVDHFQITGTEFLDAETASHFEAHVEPIAQAELDRMEARCGYTVAVTVLPGLAVGPTHQRLRLATDLADAEQIEVRIEGRVDSDISLAGRGWDRERGVLQLGVLRSSQGAERELLLLVRGPHRHDAQITVEKCEPEFLEVTLGEPTEAAGGTVVRRPLKIRIPPGVADCNYIVKWAQITLATTHEDSAQMRVFVQFAVEH